MRGASIGIFVVLAVISATISGCLGSADNAAKENTTGTPAATATATPAAQISDSHVKERLTGGYNIVGPKEAPGVKLTTPSQKPEKAILDDGVIDTGNMDDISIALSADGKIVSIYANEAAFNNNGGDILLSPLVKGTHGAMITRLDIKEFKLVSNGVYRYDVDVQELKEKYNLPTGTRVWVQSSDDSIEEIRAANERGGWALAEFVVD
ncbi:MAG: hypothetical protein O8C64_04425 [Candidatus Methanoperedens sp.]|nr:hypothetical protein [Candidatus Methanoperedens sp.]MCZ7403632.1 hypothetical protein [Candidatus Methanoperedens sp.]